MMEELENSEKSTREILEKYKSAQVAQNFEQGAEALAELQNREPSRWQRLLAIDLLPPPGDRNLSEAAKFFFHALLGLMEKLGVDGLGRTNGYASVIHGINVLDKVKKSIQKRLNDIDLSSQSKSTWLFRLLIYLESQHHIVERKIFEQVMVGDLLDMSAIMRASVPSMTGDTSVPLVSAIESIIEDVDLLLRYVLHTRAKEDFGSIDFLMIPYNDSEFAIYAALGHMWRLVDDIYAKIRYLGWVTKPRSDVEVFCPSDNDAHIRSHVGLLRQYQLQAEWAGMTMSDPELNGTDTLVALNLVANSIKFPSRGEIWNGNLDVIALRDACKQTSFRLAQQKYVNFRYYSQLIPRLKFQGPDGYLDWDTWLRISSILRVLATALLIAARNQTVDLEGDECARAVVLIDMECLLHILSEASELALNVCQTAVGALTFSEKRKHLEIWDQPVFRLGKNLIALPPALIIHGSPIRAIENFIAEYAPANAMSVRGESFEMELIDFFSNQVVGAKATGSIEFLASDNRHVQFDVAVWWQECLILIELKCVKSVHSPADEDRALLDVETAIEQLKRRKALRGYPKSIMSYSSVFKQQFRDSETEAGYWMV